MRDSFSKRRSTLPAILLMMAFLAVPSIALGAGDDCPPPSESPLDDPGYVPNDEQPAGDAPSGGDAPSEKTSSDGTFGSLGSMSSGQLTIGVIAVVGVIVGAVYLLMVGRGEE